MTETNNRGENKSMLPPNYIRPAKLGFVFIILFFTGISSATAQINPILQQRENNLSAVYKQKLNANRAVLLSRKVKFVISATEASQRSVKALTGAKKTAINNSLFNSRINKKYEIQPLYTVNTKVYSMRSRNLVSPIRNQWNCGSCWDFAIIACAETNYLMRHSKTDSNAININISEQQLLCNSNVGTCNGGATSTAAQWLFTNKVNMLSESRLPYKSSLPKLGNEAESCPTPTSPGRTNASLYRVVDFGLVPIKPGKLIPDVIDIKQAILEHGAVTASFWADSLVFAQIIAWYAGGEYEEQEPTYTPPNYTPKPVGHAVAIVGWDDNIQCWIIKNSWGTIWGDNGYGLFKYGAHNIGSDATWVEVEKVKPFLPIIIKAN